jgi:starvation-inducible DNA-binding protein
MEAARVSSDRRRYAVANSRVRMKTRFIPTQNNLPKSTRRAMIELLNQQLADALDLGLQAKQAHWNVKGPHFIGLHELFDKVAEELEEFTDDIAERAVELGGVALGTMQVVSKKSRLGAYSLKLTSGREHVAALSNALAQFGTTIRAAIDIAAMAGDADTADLFTEVSRGVDKLLWFVEAHMQAKV